MIEKLRRGCSVTVTNAPVTHHVDLIRVESRPGCTPPIPTPRRRHGYQRSHSSHLRTCTLCYSGTQVLSLSYPFAQDGAHDRPPGTQNQHSVWAEGRHRRVHVYLSVPYRGEAAGWPIIAERGRRGYQVCPEFISSGGYGMLKLR